MKNKAARGGSEGDNNKAPSTSKFHFSKGKYGNIVLAWHGVLVQKAEANFLDICAQARKIFGVTDVEKGNDNRRAQNVNPEVRTRVGLESESEEANDSDGDDEEHVNGNNKDDQNSHGNDGDNDAVNDGNSQNDENDAGEEIEELEVDPSPSRHGGRCHRITKA